MNQKLVCHQWYKNETGYYNYYKKIIYALFTFYIYKYINRYIIIYIHILEYFMILYSYIRYSYDFIKFSLNIFFNFNLVQNLITIISDLILLLFTKTVLIIFKIN